MGRQLRLNLEREASQRREDFIVSAPNADAVALVDAWPAWPGGVLALVGGPGTGKSHLAVAWAGRAHAAVIGHDASVEALARARGRPMLIEAADQAPDDFLFHAMTMAAADGQGLLLTGRTSPLEWPAQLPDLRSRLAALPVAGIDQPDDVILRGVMDKFFRERNIRPTDDVFPYLIQRIERSAPQLLRLVSRLDEVSGAEHRPVSRLLAKQVLEADEKSPDLFDSRLAGGGVVGDNDGTP